MGAAAAVAGSCWGWTWRGSRLSMSWWRRPRRGGARSACVCVLGGGVCVCVCLSVCLSVCVFGTSIGGAAADVMACVPQSDIHTTPPPSSPPSSNKQTNQAHAKMEADDGGGNGDEDEEEDSLLAAVRQGQALLAEHLHAENQQAASGGWVGG
jgi:hypothetical protein